MFLGLVIIVAEIFAYTLNMTYELIDPPILNDEIIKNLYLSGEIKFLPRYNEKFKKRYLKC